MGQLLGVVRMLLIIIHTSKRTYKLFCDKQCETEDSLTYSMNAMVNLVAKQTQEMDKFVILFG